MTSFLPELGISGVGVTSAIGQGQKAFAAALFRGETRFGVMKRPGRQRESTASANESSRRNDTAYLGAEIAELSLPKRLPKAALRSVSFSEQVAIATLQEAWDDAKLEGIDPVRVGLIVGGSNFQQRELVLAHDAYRNRFEYLRPTYGMAFMDSDLCALCTEHFAIGGLAHSIGGASASGQLAVIHAAQAVASGQVDVCIALGALMDLSFWECQGFRNLGAMGSTRYADEPSLAARPFDRDRDGFIYGESCGALVIERLSDSARRGAEHYARLAGWATQLDRNRAPSPSLQGEIDVIGKALQHAKVPAATIDYVNPHGSGSVIGDETELQAIRASGLAHAHLNATKSITGHGLTAAGAVEVVATLLQMKHQQLHPSRNLDNPLDATLPWVGASARAQKISHALSISIGFGGINTAVCLQHI